MHRQPHDYTGTPEAAGAWEACFTELGAALIDKGNAVFSDRGAGGGTAPVLPLGGYTIVSAADRPCMCQTIQPDPATSR